MTRPPAPGGRPSNPLDEVIDQIRRTHGDGSIMALGAGSAGAAVEGISSGSRALDAILGAGGYPRGRITEIYGPEASGKSTLALAAAASAQKAGGVAVLIDSEHVLHPAYARAVGVDLDHLLVSQPDCGEQALDIAEQLVRSNRIDLIVVDSVAALVPRAELEGELGDDSDPGAQARLLSQSLRRVAGALPRSRTAVIFVNQIRTRIGTFFGNPETTPGGRALKFYASIRMELRPVGVIKEEGEVTGMKVGVKVVKNKIAPPFRMCEVGIRYESGLEDV